MCKRAIVRFLDRLEDGFRVFQFASLFLSPHAYAIGKCKNAAAKLIRAGEREGNNGKRQTKRDRRREKEAEQEISSAAILGEICLH